MLDLSKLPKGFPAYSYPMEGTNKGEKEILYMECEVIGCYRHPSWVVHFGGFDSEPWIAGITGSHYFACSLHKNQIIDNTHLPYKFHWEDSETFKEHLEKERFKKERKEEV